MFSENMQYFFDIIFILLTSIIWIPIFLIILVTTAIIQKKIFYAQYRYGKNFKIFKIYKFLTIPENIDIKDINYYNRFLRRSSFDELPQILNIIRKEMSLVGPRPLLQDVKIDIKNPLIIEKHKVLPGLTGLSQIKSIGRKREMEEKLNLDSIYVNERNFILYFTILFKTIFTLVIRFVNNKSGDTL